LRPTFFCEQNMNTSPDITLPIVWSIAGSDSGAGAGLQADLRAFDAFEVHGCTAVAAITAQNSIAVDSVEIVATAVLEAQLAALASDLPPKAIKTGMLGNADNVRCVARWVDRLRTNAAVALVVDPVWRASTGADLAGGALRQALLSELLPRATVITPNRAEAAWLLDWDAASMAERATVERAAAALRALGAGAVVITGGDAGGADALDYIDTPQAQGWLRLPRIATAHHHGSGCVFAASVAAALTRDFCAADAAVLAKMNTAGALRNGVPAGRGAGAVRPRPGFALASASLPDLLAPGFDFEAAPKPPFARLSDANMGLYGVTDNAARIEQLLDAGVRTLQLRIKQGPREFLSAEIKRSIEAARRVDAQLFINDHWQLALEHGAYGVHLGQEDLMEQGAGLEALRAAGVRVGLSTHCLWELCRARALAPSYIACGPVHATNTKEMPWIPRGAGNLAYWCHIVAEPVVAIAGMNVERSIEAVRCGATGIAVLSGVNQPGDPSAAVAELQSAIAAAASAAPLPVPDLPRSTLPGWQFVR
jgi:hydroxymethylpyrimidine kinase/phosphomethylpyrimidine kinase/thiamine-phosphate diphosphorylase